MYRAKMPKIEIKYVDSEESEQQLKSAYDFIFGLARDELVKQKSETNTPLNNSNKTNDSKEK